MTVIDETSDNLQLLLVGGHSNTSDDLVAKLSSKHPLVTTIGADQWSSTSWQNNRRTGEAWALIDLDAQEERPFEEHLNCVQLVSLVFRPTRLLVVRRALPTEKLLFLLKAGANGFVEGQATAEDIRNAFLGESINHEELFPSPVRWLHTLVRAAEELGLSENPTHQSKKLLRFFATELKVGRASLVIQEAEGLRFEACVGMPEQVKEGDMVEVRPGSIMAWVLEQRRARLIEGEYVRSDGSQQKSEVRSAICAPLIADDEIFGVVSFSSLEGGRMLNQADLATAEVFAKLLALNTSNRKLHTDIVEKERLASVGATVSSISHCVKNLLTVLDGSVSIMGMALEREDFGQMTMAHHLLQKGVGRIEALVMDLLDFSKDRKPEPAPTNLEDIIDTISESFNIMSMHTPHSLTTTNEVSEKVMVDENRLQRALMNLVSNAIDATPNGGMVSLTMQREEDWLALTVEDDGPGVNAEKLETIYEPFYSTKGSKGTGLGLAMVFKFISECGGRVEAGRSRHLGGFQIKLLLPYEGTTA